MLYRRWTADGQLFEPVLGHTSVLKEIIAEMCGDSLCRKLAIEKMPRQV
jgi:hypothetical protein